MRDDRILDPLASLDILFDAGQALAELRHLDALKFLPGLEGLGDFLAQTDEAAGSCAGRTRRSLRQSPPPYATLAAPTRGTAETGPSRGDRASPDRPATVPRPGPLPPVPLLAAPARTDSDASSRRSKASISLRGSGAPRTMSELVRSSAAMLNGPLRVRAIEFLIIAAASAARELMSQKIFNWVSGGPGGADFAFALDRCAAQPGCEMSRSLSNATTSRIFSTLPMATMELLTTLACIFRVSLP